MATASCEKNQEIYMRDEHAKQQVVEMKICDITLYC